MDQMNLLMIIKVVDAGCFAKISFVFVYGLILRIKEECDQERSCNCLLSGTYVSISTLAFPPTFTGISQQKRPLEMHSLFRFGLGRAISAATEGFLVG